jgi:multicomponent Na+:H+ antiporter subunit E
MLFWLLLSGHYDLMHVSFGIFSVTLVMLMNYSLRRRLFAMEEHSGDLKLSLLRLIGYIPWLLWQIVIASLQVAWVVLRVSGPCLDGYLLYGDHRRNLAGSGGQTL